MRSLVRASRKHCGPHHGIPVRMLDRVGTLAESPKPLPFTTFEDGPNVGRRAGQLSRHGAVGTLEFDRGPVTGRRYPFVPSGAVRLVKDGMRDAHGGVRFHAY